MRGRSEGSASEREGLGDDLGRGALIVKRSAQGRIELAGCRGAPYGHVDRWVRLAGANWKEGRCVIGFDTRGERGRVRIKLTYFPGRNM